MGSLNNFNTASGALGALRTAKNVKEGNEEVASLLQQLIWEQQQNNKMMWVTLTDEQRAAFHALP